MNIPGLRPPKDWTRVERPAPPYQFDDAETLEIKRFYLACLDALDKAGVEYLVGGAYALTRYTGIERNTKDLDIFLRPSDCEKLLDVLERLGYETELTFRHWLAKAIGGEHQILDIIFSSGNGHCEVDDAWFEHARTATAIGREVRIIPPEEMIWSKTFICERERFDGGDVAHLLGGRDSHLDWRRLLDRFGDHWTALYGHVIFFHYAYPSEQQKIPSWVMDEFSKRLAKSRADSSSAEKVCRGTLLSRSQYRDDVELWGFTDARLEPRGSMTPDDVVQVYAAYNEDRPPLRQIA